MSTISAQGQGKAGSGEIDISGSYEPKVKICKYGNVKVMSISVNGLVKSVLCIRRY